MWTVLKESERENKETSSKETKRMCALFCVIFRFRVAMTTTGDSSQSAAKCFKLKVKTGSRSLKRARLT